MENKEIVVQDEKDTIQAEQDTAIVVHLKKPLDYNGKIYDRITLDLDKLTGKDSLDIEEELMRRKKGAVIYGALNNDYVLAVAAKACREPIGSDAFLQMNIKDHLRVRDAVRNFLLR